MAEAEQTESEHTGERTLAEVMAQDEQHAREYGAAAARLPEARLRTWEDLAPRLGQGWSFRHAELCDYPHDWRLSFGGVRAGWQEAIGG